MPDALALIARHLRHPDLHACLATMGEEADLRADLRLCDLDLVGIQMDLDEAIGSETPDGIYHKWERVADVVAAVRRYAGEASCHAA